MIVEIYNLSVFAASEKFGDDLGFVYGFHFSAFWVRRIANNERVNNQAIFLGRVTLSHLFYLFVIIAVFFIQFGGDSQGQSNNVGHLKCSFYLFAKVKTNAGERYCVSLLVL